MTLVYSANQLPTTNAQVWYDLMTLLVSAGWTKAAAGDGISAYSASDGTAITSYNSGANGFDNPNAWIFIKMPGSNRGFVFQNISSTNVTVRYFGPSSLVTNSPDYQTPSVSTTTNAGSQDVVNNTAFVGTLNRVHYWADNSSPYGFGVHGWNTAGTPTFHFVLDGMQTNTYHPLNQDPYVITALPDGKNNFIFGSNMYGGPYVYAWTPNTMYNYANQCWLNYNRTGSGFYNINVSIVLPAAIVKEYYDAYLVYTTIGQPVSQYDGKDEEIDIRYMIGLLNNGFITGGKKIDYDYGAGTISRVSSSVFQGVSSYLRNYMQYRSATPFLNTLSINSTRDRLVIGHVTVPNDGSIPLIP